MKTIFCNVHGYTHWEPQLLQIINTPEFQRLRHIKQLASVYHVFPGATHTRFEHSIGVGHLAHQFAATLLASDPLLQIDPFVLKMAGLCHDLGHGPMSHAFDRFLEQRGVDSRHEDRSCDILRRIVFSHCIPIRPSDVEAACELISPKTRALPAFWYQIIANDIDDIDVDKLDYLKRDAMNTGIAASIDIQRFFLYSRVVNGRLCFAEAKMSFAINQLFMTRHQLHHQVYQHKVVRAIELMYMDVMHTLGDIVCDESAFLDLTDCIFQKQYVAMLKQSGLLNATSASAAARLLDRIDRRDLYSCLVSMPIRAETAERLRRRFDTQDCTEILVLDIVIIGYQHNPLFRVEFYDDKGRTARIPVKDASTAFPRRSQDCFFRLYTRRQRDQQSLPPYAATSNEANRLSCLPRHPAGTLLGGHFLSSA